MYPAESLASTTAVWFLVGPLETQETIRYQPIHSLPFTIGRRGDLSLSLPCRTVSSLHAEIYQSQGGLWLRDLGSTNGTYVNARRIEEPVQLQDDDLLQFACIAFRVRRQAGQNSVQATQTIAGDAYDRALALVQFDKLMSERAVVPYFQPIVDLQKRAVLAYEVLGRSRLYQMETPKEMFRAAAQLNLETELSVMLRWEGVQAGKDLPGDAHLFVNTHPRELAQSGLIESLRAIRQQHPAQKLTLEIHELAATNPAQIMEIRQALKDLDMSLAYDDFGVGQSRLNELAECRPDYVKFDMSLIRDINSASPQRQQMLATLVHMVCDLGIRSLAEGVETEAEDQTCREMGFELGQGFLYGRPASVRTSDTVAGGGRR